MNAPGSVNQSIPLKFSMKIVIATKCSHLAVIFYSLILVYGIGKTMTGSLI